MGGVPRCCSCRRPNLGSLLPERDRIRQLPVAVATAAADRVTRPSGALKPYYFAVYLSREGRALAPSLRDARQHVVATDFRMVKFLKVRVVSSLVSALATPRGAVRRARRSVLAVVHSIHDSLALTVYDFPRRVLLRRTRSSWSSTAATRARRPSSSRTTTRAPPPARTGTRSSAVLARIPARCANARQMCFFLAPATTTDGDETRAHRRDGRWRASRRARARRPSSRRARSRRARVRRSRRLLAPSRRRARRARSVRRRRASDRRETLAAQRSFRFISFARAYRRSSSDRRPSVHPTLVFSRSRRSRRRSSRTSTRA